MSIGSLCVSGSPHSMGFQELLIQFTRSNALDASKKQEYTGVLC